MRNRAVLIQRAAGAVLLWLALATAGLAADNERVAEELRRFIDAGEPVIGNEDRDERIIEVYLFYAGDRDYKPVWVRDSGPKSKAKEVVEAMKAAAAMGLDPASYRLDDIERRMGATEPRELAELELLLSRAFIDFGRDVNRGRVLPADASAENAITSKELGPLTLIGGAEYADSIGAYVASIEPQTPQYALLKAALADYRAIEAQGGWPTVTDGPSLRPEMRDPSVPTIRRYLWAAGDLNKDAADQGDLYDADLLAAVKWFQYRHGLKEDGIVGGDTLAEMRVPVGDRILQMELNLERRRWMDDDLGRKHIFVNIADQFLKLVKDGETIHTARLVVGKPTTRTPVFSETMKYIVINPYWHVPQGIANEEYLPKLKKNAGALRREGIRLFSAKGGTSSEIDPAGVDWKRLKRMPYSLRQDSGPKNALGRMKFMFPNRFDVYIHDTPAKSLFERDLRAFSHGCMRVEDPARLASLLLADQGWTQAKIEAAVNSDKQRVINLAKPLPVHVTYLTAWVNKDRSVHFRRDVYGRDTQLEEALADTVAH